MTKPPKENPVPKDAKRIKKGLIMVHTGDGKGKTSAALGMAMRCVGNHMKVMMVQFIKGAWKYGELAAAERLAPWLEIRPMGEGFTWDTKDRERDIEMTARAWEFGREKMMSGEYAMVIFDEINYVIDYQYLDPAKVIVALRDKPADVHVILTGRNAHPGIVEIADLVTEMKEVKHPFKQGILAQKGVEF
ncbi:MAG: cob(I)yrinic acid a,c-diamide adenosyltransferase [Candidatus Omnitrophica bacterium]|nr:cob(I)yrinic acid a,c-diamide adenosyltransferase [Candidatus Omnitrophota bacterium]